MFSDILEKLMGQLSKIITFGNSTNQLLLTEIKKWSNQELDFFLVNLKKYHQTKPCLECGFLTLQEKCGFCLSSKNKKKQLLILENSFDILLLNKMSFYNGYYFSLNYLLDISQLPNVNHSIFLIEKNIQEKNIQEMIFCLNYHFESNYTIKFLIQKIKKKFPHLLITRIGNSFSKGLVLKFANDKIIKEAFLNRKKIT